MTSSVLLKAAMLGTNRSSDLGVAPHDALQPVWHALSESADPAQALLQAAAIEHIYQQAGVIALSIDPPPVSDPETRPYVNPAVANAFVDLAQGNYGNLAHEWINEVQLRKLIATPRLLPALLDIGELKIGQRCAISDIVGERGRWLASRVGKWSWLGASSVSVVSDELWKTGTPAERLQWLQQQLGSNPELAAESIAASWPGDSPESREAFTRQVARMPHTAHEEWLQKYALTDRRQSTRLQAVRSLMLIESSGFRKRSLERAGALLSVPKNLLGKKQLQCQPPTEFDPGWTSDGLREKPPSGRGPRDFWLLQILSVIPLRDWPALIGHDNPLALDIESDWSETVLEAWRQSAMTFSDSEATKQLLKRLAAYKDDAGKASAIAAIVSTLDIKDVADILEQLKLPESQCFELIRSLVPPLSIERHPKLHKIATDWVFGKNRLNRPDAVALAACCDRHAIPALLVKISKAEELTAAAEEFTRTLEYRQSYLKHFDTTVPSG